MTSSANIPDRMDPEELLKLLSVAPKEEEVQAPPKSERKYLTEEEADEATQEILDLIDEKFNSLYGHKAVALACIYRIFMFHNAVCKDLIENVEDRQDLERALSWGRDAGWLQCMLRDLTDVCCGPDDHLAGAADD